MSKAESDQRVCDQCGAPLGRHLREGLCTRCLARYFPLAEEALEQKSEVRSPELAVSSPQSAVPSLQSAVTSQQSGDGGPTPIARFGDYELLEEIAHGGMGVVYKALQISLKRIVAVKMLLFGQFASKSAFDRFRAEAETAARLQHPNIVAIHGIGETEGQPYFSMDYVAGRNLADLVREHPLPAQQAARYVRKVAQAVHYAHTQGVLHRDLKPANVLIDADDEPRVTDFGLAKRLTDSAFVSQTSTLNPQPSSQSSSQLSTLNSQLTLTGQVLGSPNFMPPEQGAGKKARLTPASDVYGLGALMYYLLTARPPFVAETFEATLSQVLHNDPVPPRQLNPGLQRDLETLCLKCLEKDPGRRYASAEEVAHELDRFLKGEPIHAHPLGPLGKGWRWCKRKPVVAGMTAAVLISLIAVTVVSLLAARRVAEEARRTTAYAQDLRLNLYVADMNVAYQAIQGHKPELARQVIRKYLPTAEHAQRRAPKGAASALEVDLRGWEWRYLWGLCRHDATATLRSHSNSVTCVQFTPDGTTLITASFDQTVRVWDVATKRTVRVLMGFRDKLQRNSVALSPDGKSLAVADGTDIQVFETTSWNRLRTLTNQTSLGYVDSLPIAFSPDGKTLSCNAETEIRQWNTTTWEQLPSQSTNLVDEFTRLLTYSLDGRHFATAKQEGIAVWDSYMEPPSQRFLGQLRWPITAAFSPDGKTVAAGGVSGEAIIWSVEDEKEMVRLPLGETATLGVAVAWSLDGRQLAVTGNDGGIRLWEPRQGKLMLDLQAYGGISALAFSPDGKTLASGCGDGAIRLFSTLPRRITETGPILGRLLCYSDDGSSLAVQSTNSTIEYWDTRSRKLVRSFKIPTRVDPRDKVATSRDGSLLAHVSVGGMARVWERDSGQQVGELALNPPAKMPNLAFSPDKRLIAISDTTRLRGGGGWMLIWDFRKGESRVVPGLDVYGPLFSPDGKRLATGFGHDVRVWSVPELKPTATLKGQASTISGMAFSPDGALLAVMGRGSGMRLWDLATGQVRFFSELAGGNSLSSDAFSPDGKTLASGSHLTPDLWNVATGKKVFALPGTNHYLDGAMFSPDGREFVRGGIAGWQNASPIELFQAPALEEIDAAEKAEAEAK